MKREKGKGKRVKEKSNSTRFAIRYTIGHALYAALLFACLFSFSGCWDLEEVDHRAFATTIGIDANPEKEEILLSAIIPQPQKMTPSGATGGQQQSGQNFNTISASGRTVQEAFSKLKEKTHGRLDIQQNKSIIIGEQTARLGTVPLMQWLFRSAEEPPQALVFIAGGKTAREILTFSSNQEILPSLQLTISGQDKEKYDRTYFLPLWRFQQKLIDETKDTYAPLLDIDPQEKQYIESGIAVFNSDRLAGELDGSEAQSFGLLKSLMRNGTMTIEISPEKIISLSNVKGKTSTKVVIRNHIPVFLVRTTVSGKLSEITGQPLLITPAVTRRLETELDSELQKQLTAVIHKLQTYNSDIINFGEELRVQHQSFWQKTDWKKVFPTVPFSVAVKVKIERDGVLR